jgi:hypothetical protein
VVKHSACARGKRVLIVLRDGTRLEDKFLERGRGWILLERAGRVSLETVRAFTILRGGRDG